MTGIMFICPTNETGFQILFPNGLCQVHRADWLQLASGSASQSNGAKDRGQ